MDHGTHANRAACPGLEALEELLDRQAGAPHDAVAAHVEGCSACRDRLVEIRNNNALLQRFAPVAGRVELTSALAPRGGWPAIEIPGYEVESMIAVGGQGEVYKARQRATGRAVAIKVPLGGSRNPAAMLSRFQREVELTARLDHPGIVRVFGTCDLADGRLGCVMEFVEGEPIDAWAARQHAAGRAGLRRIIEVMAQVADAIAYAHQRAVMHRDIKPSNVIVTPDGVPRVLDFGLAKALSSDVVMFATLPGAFVGTLAYAAPEQFDGASEATDLRTDVYGLGLLLFQGLTGRLPFSTDASPPELSRRIREAVYPLPSSLNSAIGSELDAIVLKALGKEKERRYATGAELREDLRRWLDGRAVHAKLDSRWYVLRKAVARRRGLLAAVLSVLITAGVGLVASAYNLAAAQAANARETYERSRAATERRKSAAVQQVLDELIPPALLTSSDDSGKSALQALALLNSKLDAGLLEGRPLVEAGVRSMLGAIYSERGALPLAEWQYRVALRMRFVELGEANPETADVMDALSLVLLGRGKHTEALALAERALAVRRAELGSHHIDVAKSLNTLARVKLGGGQLADAERDAIEAGEVIRAVVPGEEPIVAENLTLLAQIKVASGALRDARELASRALALRFRSNTDDHPSVIHAIAFLAEVEGRSGGAAVSDATLAAALEATSVHDRPAEVWIRLIELKRRLFGDNDPEVAQSLMSLGIDRQRAGDHNAAIAAIRQAITIFELAEGPESMTVISCSRYLLESMSRRGAHEECEPLLRRRYSVLRKLLPGRGHIEVIVVHRELANYLAWQGKDAEALREYRDVLRDIDDLMYSDVVEKQRALLGLAELHAARGEDAEAEAIALRAIETTSGGTTGEELERRRAELVLGVVRACRGDLEAATPLLTGAAHIVTPASWQYANPTTKRMVLRLVKAYQGHPYAEVLSRFPDVGATDLQR
ncbi:MAG: hypothetical protein AMXMBFR58_36080 [Phycisphaerae bacterium]